ncbi:MAG: peptide deformylase [Actinomycetota bacterium]|nr:peptide deformylase [Actinomycetota bacterium]
MGTLRIRTFGDPVLRERARPVEEITQLHATLIDNMIETMRDAPGVGLAATQVGVLDRLFVWEVEERHGAVINPVIVDRSAQTEVDDEGCLSLPGLLYPVERSTSVVVEGVDQEGSAVHLEADGLLARVCQHEIDHLDGVLFIDRLPADVKREAIRKLNEEALGLGMPQPTAEVHPR